ncbi:MAG: hypothetical protein AVDCRST_MAG66-1673 [uncultured Pseudonocardia sp.]|uniref:Uncharacterized protein n=1 Tax=uncultured Pseudonocardia sp. TaxID=211455 RepID=A0A6J4P8B3_9PSEU|nr:MAG: hypothetical protein AVDCRST_MAG66-1673 [uncultured Pseudonocardia sp.]
MRVTCAASRKAAESDQHLYRRLTSYFTPTEQRGVGSLAARIVAAAGGPDGLPMHRIMVAYGGGKDSSYVVAFARAAQLALQLEHGRTFPLRVANMRHAGVTHAVMQNIHRVYSALQMMGDPRVELLTVDHTEIRPFRVDLPFPPRVREMNRVDVLMNGHMSGGDGRPTFCNSCNLSVADFYGRAAWWSGGVNAIMTGDSRREQAMYRNWIMRLADACGLDVAECRRRGFRGVLSAVQGIGDAYFRELFGDDDEELSKRAVATGDGAVDPEFLSIYDLVSYRVDDHWDLIVGFLGFEFDDLAFSFTESDCANPGLMAHLRGLRAESVEGRTYEDGIAQYLQFADFLMRRKEMPTDLIRLALARYDTADKVRERRRAAAEFAEQAFGLDEDALIAMVHSPFAGGGARLKTWLAARHPDRLPSLTALHAVLDGGPGEQGEEWLQRVTGLDIARLRQLYGNAAVDFESSSSIMARVRAGDPHKLQIEVVNPSTGRAATQTISGR